jgi:hypothetical protein
MRPQDDSRHRHTELRSQFLRFRRLHESVVQHAPPDVMHHVLVPPPDVGRFSSIDDLRLSQILIL